MDPALLKRSAPRAPSRSRVAEREADLERMTADRAGDPKFDLIELFFFAYRDFVGDADRLLEAYKFGRAHHRVLHFVNRHPGLTIAELLDILRITKQSLNRVLKELLDQSYVEARPGVTDRRQRLLFPTPEGRKLALEVARLQSERFSRVLAALGEGARAEAVAFLLEMIDPDERDKAARLVWPEAKGDA
jgi:DNA-binding MarR family transcriptional regulator